MISDRAQGSPLISVTRPLIGVFDDPAAVSANTAAFMAKLRLTMTVARSDDFITVLFDAHHPSVADVLQATVSGLWANFHTFNPLILERVMRQDYLWQDNCFECFIAADQSADAPYLEINLATNGAFNLYYFDGYRQPNSLPPPRLATNRLSYGDDMNFFNQALSHPDTHPVVFWHTAGGALAKHVREVEVTYPLLDNGFRVGMTFATAALKRLLGTGTYGVINPTRVLKSGWLREETVAEAGVSYWAVNHANPADFHDKTSWLGLANAF